MDRKHTVHARRMRGVAIWLTDGKCFVCDHRPAVIEVHYLDGNTKNNHLFNLVPLCDQCHALAHRSNMDLTKWAKFSIVCIFQKAADYHADLEHINDILYAGNDEFPAIDPQEDIDTLERFRRLSESRNISLRERFGGDRAAT